MPDNSSMRHSKSRVLKSFAWSFMERIGVRFVNLLVQIVLARILDADAFGVIAILLVVVNVADSIAMSGLGMALVQGDDITEESFSTAFWLSLGLSGIIYLILFVGAPVMSSFYSMPTLATYMRVLSLVVLFDGINSIQRAYLQKNMDFKRLFVTNTISALTSGVIGVVMAIMGLGVWALIWQTLSQAICVCLVLLFVVPWKPALVFNRSIAGGLFSYGWKICATSILNVFYTGISDLILGRTCSSSDLGMYSQGRKWPNAVITLVTNALQNVLFPAFAELKNDMEAFRHAARKALVAGTFIAVPAVTCFAVVAEPLIAILLTEKWLPAKRIFQMLCISNAVLIIQLVNLRAYMALGASGFYLRIQIVKVALGVLVIGGTAYIARDIYAVAFATAALGVFNILVVDTWGAKRMFGYSRAEQLRDVWKIYLVALVAGIIAWVPAFFLDSYVLRLIIQTAIFCGAYLLIARSIRLEGYSDCMRILKDGLHALKRRGERSKL